MPSGTRRNFLVTFKCSQQIGANRIDTHALEQLPIFWSDGHAASTFATTSNPTATLIHWDDPGMGRHTLTVVACSLPPTNSFSVYSTHWPPLSIRIVPTIVQSGCLIETPA